MEIHFTNVLDLSDAIIVITDDYRNGYVEYVEYVHYLNQFEENNRDIIYKNNELNNEVVSLIGEDRAQLVVEALF